MMGAWKSMLKADPTEWLLEPDNPSVRYFALTEILGRSGNDPVVRSAKKGIMKTGVVPRILAKEHEDGYWEKPGIFYTAKYRGTVWQLLVLAELGADGKDARIKKACKHILKNSQDNESGGFSMHMNTSRGGGRHSEVIPCLTGNMTWALIKLGFLRDPGVQRAINWILAYQRYDDGVEEAPKGWPYDRLKMCFGRHTCHMGVAKSLKALAEIPAGKRTGEVKDAIMCGVEYVLIHHIHKRSHDLRHVSKPGWRHFGFPLMYQTDVLEILGILTSLGVKDERMQEAVDLVVSKQDSRGRWCLESTFNGRFLVNIEHKGEPSKWITLKALNMLKKYHG